jgi:hypothetical protein
MQENCLVSPLVSLSLLNLRLNNRLINGSFPVMVALYEILFLSPFVSHDLFCCFRSAQLQHILPETHRLLLSWAKQ